MRITARHPIQAGEKLKSPLEYWRAPKQMVYTYQKNQNGDFVCQHCGKTVPGDKQSTMNMHYNAKHNGDLPHECDQCDKKFATKQALDFHLLARHQVNCQAQTDYTCPFPGCNFVARTRGNRRIHYFRKHMKEEVHKMNNDLTCRICNHQFNNKPSFLYHCIDCVPEGKIPREIAIDI